MNGAAAVQPMVLDAASQPLESFADPGLGTVHWHTLFSSDRTPTESLTCGLAILSEGDFLALHRHEPPEVYFGVEGVARVVVEGNSYELRPGVAVFIPGDAVHGVFAENGDAKFFYAFARDSFSEVVYKLLHDAPSDPEVAEELSAEPDDLILEPIIPIEPEPTSEAPRQAAP